MLTPTPGQTVGPFFGYALPYDGDARAGAARPARTRSGCTAGCSTAPATRCPDALVEVWQAGAGRARVPRARARCTATATRSPAGAAAATDRTGHYPFTTLAPGPTAPRRGAVLRADGLRPRAAGPAVHPRLPARTTGRERDPLLASSSPLGAHAGRRPDDRGFVFDIRLQGEGETVFLSYPTQD